MTNKKHKNKWLVLSIVFCLLTTIGVSLIISDVLKKSDIKVGKCYDNLNNEILSQSCLVKERTLDLIPIYTISTMVSIIFFTYMLSNYMRSR